MNQTLFQDICLESIFCQDEQCQLDHSRLFVGVCIQYLRNEQQWNTNASKFEQKDCNNKNCNLWHFKQRIFKDKKQVKTINGVFPHNLCPKNCKSKDCKFLHREWAQQVCLTNIVDECDTQNCEFKHVEWDSLKEIAKSQSQIKQPTPEDICSKQDCGCDKHRIFLDEYCILYLQGLCRYKKCQKTHIEWEKINPKINQTNSLQSCIVIVEERNKQVQINPNKVALLCQESEFLHYKKYFSEQNIIDVVFIMDLTESMKPWKELMENTIANIIDQFLNSINGYQVRVAFVGYRDICDKQDQLIYLSFTKKINELQNYIKKLEAKGGGDYAEDVAFGFEQALQLNFSHHEESLLCTFLLADAPCHGKDYHNYHNYKSDNLFDKMPDKYFEKVLNKYKQIKKNNFLCCVKINDTTDIMFQKMKDAFPMLTITPKTQPDDLSDLIRFSLRMSVQESKRLNSQINNEFQYFKANFVKLKLDTVTGVYENDNYWEQYQEMVDSILRKGETGLKVDKKYLNSEDIKSDQNKVEVKSSTYIFKAFDAINNREVVIKIPKTLVDNKDKVISQDISAAEEEAEARFYSSSYACQMAYFFNQRLKENKLLKEMQPLFYAHPILYTFDKPFYGMKKIYGETYIQTKKYLFEKYSNNKNFTNSEKYYYSAFSHFSYQVSQGNLVIVDLQGCNNILTDPSIQTNKSWISILDKDKTNYRNQGIYTFKNSQHKNCSYLCEKLKLDKFNQNSQIDETRCPPELVKNMYGICYECDEFASFENELLNNVKDQKFKFNCKFCQKYQCEQKRDLQCECCNYRFQVPINQQLINLTNMGACQDCKFQCSGLVINHCFYCNRKCQKNMTKITINNKPFYLCRNAYDYLQTFVCKKCSKPYNWKSEISKQNYEEKSYTCC